MTGFFSTKVINSCVFMQRSFAACQSLFICAIFSNAWFTMEAEAPIEIRASTHHRLVLDHFTAELGKKAVSYIAWSSWFVSCCDCLGVWSFLYVGCELSTSSWIWSHSKTRENPVDCPWLTKYHDWQMWLYFCVSYICQYLVLECKSTEAHCCHPRK